MNPLEIKFALPKVVHNRVIFSWSPNPFFEKNEYWVEYPDLIRLTPSEGKLTEALFPLCLAFSAVPDVSLTLPVKIDGIVLRNWKWATQYAALHWFRKKTTSVIRNGVSEPHYEMTRHGETALSFGGGVKSLLTLGRMLETGTKPLLVSLGGPDWSGSDPERNTDKFILDERLSLDYGLPLVRIRSNFRQLINETKWMPLLARGCSILNSIVRLPFFISFILPISEQLNIKRFVAPIHKLSPQTNAFCFSPEMTSAFNEIAHGLTFESQLQELYKEEICRSLYKGFPGLAHYQYSCWHNHNERWCYQCELCFEYYMIMKSIGLDVSHVGLNEEKIDANLKCLIHAVARDPHSRKGDIWTRIAQLAGIRNNSQMSKVLYEIEHRSSAYHTMEHVYSMTPNWFKLFYRNQKSFFKKLQMVYKPKLGMTSG